MTTNASYVASFIATHIFVKEERKWKGREAVRRIEKEANKHQHCNQQRMGHLDDQMMGGGGSLRKIDGEEV